MLGKHTLWKERTGEAITDRHGVFQVSLELGSVDTELRKVNASIARKSPKEQHHDGHLKIPRLHHPADILLEGVEYGDLESEEHDCDQRKEEESGRHVSLF